MVMFFLVAKPINVLIVSVVGGWAKTMPAGHVGKHKPAGLCLVCPLNNPQINLKCSWNKY